VIDQFKIYKNLKKISSKDFTVECLSDYLREAKSNLTIETKPTGQPILIHKKKVSFSLSHSEDEMALACSTQTDLGLDLQKHRPFNPKVLERLCFPEELEKTEINAEFFFKMWTIKEAALKCIGLGFQFPAKNLSVDFESSQIKIRGEIPHPLLFVEKPKILYFKKIDLFEKTTSHLVSTHHL
jgi:phosphopantetheinyl transferase